MNTLHYQVNHHLNCWSFYYCPALYLLDWRPDRRVAGRKRSTSQAAARHFTSPFNIFITRCRRSAFGRIFGAVITWLWGHDSLPQLSIDCWTLSKHIGTVDIYYISSSRCQRIFLKSYASFPKAEGHRKDMVCTNESTSSSRVWWTRSTSFWIWVMVDCSIFGSGVYGSDVEEVGCDRPYQWRWQWNRVWSDILVPCMLLTQSHERQYIRSQVTIY